MVAKKFVPSLESLSSLGFEGRNLGCPRILAGISRTPGGAQTVCAKKVRAHFSFPMRGSDRFGVSDLKFANGRGRFGGQTAGGHPKASPWPRQPPLQCRHLESSKVLAGLAFCEMQTQYRRSAFQGH